MNSRRILAACAVIIASTGCVKKKTATEAKAIRNTETNEEIVEDLLNLPVESPDGSGNLPTDPAALKAINDKSQAFCFLSRGIDGALKPVTKRYVVAHDVFAALDDGVAGETQALAARTEEETKALAAAVAGGASSAGLALAGGNGARTISARLFQEIRRVLSGGAIFEEIDSSGVRQVIRFNPKANNGSGGFSLGKFDAKGNKVAVTEYFRPDDPRVARYVKLRKVVSGIDAGDLDKQGRRIFHEITKSELGGKPAYRVRDYVIDNAFQGKRKIVYIADNANLTQAQLEAAIPNAKARGAAIKGFTEVAVAALPFVGFARVEKWMNRLKQGVQSLDGPVKSALATCNGSAKAMLACYGATVVGFTGFAAAVVAMGDDVKGEEEALVQAERFRNAANAIEDAPQVNAVGDGGQEAVAQAGGAGAIDVSLGDAAFQAAKAKLVALSESSSLPECPTFSAAGDSVE